jgi:hypothetical protein
VGDLEGGFRQCSEQVVRPRQSPQSDAELATCGSRRDSIGMVGATGKAKYSLHKLRRFFASWAIEQGFAEIETTGPRCIAAQPTTDLARGHAARRQWWVQWRVAASRL